MKSKKMKRFSIITAALLAFTFMIQGATSLLSDLASSISFATSGNTVYLDKSSVEATTANLVYVDLVVEGQAGEKVKVAYKTFSATAIRDIDFVSVENTITLTIDPSFRAKYTIAIKCLNDSSNREKLRVYDKDNTYGRYFDLQITGADNASIVESKKSCKCYLTYNNKVEATVGIHDSVFGREVAYLNDYREMLKIYEEGTGGLDGGSTRKSWQKGVSFNNETTKRWQNVYINTGFAQAYGSFVIKTIDDGTWSNDGSVSVLAGNKQFIDNYKREKNIPGMYFYAKIDPPGERLDGKAMGYIGQWINPYKKDDDLVDAKDIRTVGTRHTHIYWIQDSNAWYASKNSVYDSEFYVIDPYNGVLDQGVAAYNHNTEADMRVKDIWQFMTLYDNTAPTVTANYCDYSEENNTLRIYLRFNEPVYSCKKRPLTVKINNYNTEYEAKYLTGNYSDTLVYEISENIPREKISSIKYTIYPDDVGDMAYILDAWKNVQHNHVLQPTAVRQATVVGGSIDLTRPELSADIQSSSQPRNIYNIVLSANDNGQRNFDTGVVYYSWDNNSEIQEPQNPLSYNYSHVLTSEEMGSFTVSLAKNESQGITSGNYYLHALAVSKYGFKDVDTFGPYLLDGDAPVINGMTITPNELQTKIYNLELANKALGTSLKKLVLNLTYTPSLGEEQTKKLTLIDEGEISPSVANIFKIISGANVTTYQYKSNIDPTKVADIPLDTFIQDIMGTSNRLSATVHFTMEDAAGNRASTNPQPVVYDVRELFEVNVDIPEPPYIKDTSIDLPYDVYNTKNVGEDDAITFSITDTTIQSDIDDGAVFSLTINNDTVVEGTGYSVSLKNLPAGHYDIVGRVAGTTSGGEVDLVSKATSFTLTDDLKDKTPNKDSVDGNLVLTNHVYQLEDARFYYFNPTSNTVNNHLYGAIYNESTGRYEGGSNYPSFSSSIEAKKYIKYMEYQDLQLISISDTIASLLNSGTGSTTYVKATGETKNAQAGQLWVRYKKNTWTTNTGTSGWAFYYYGEGDANEGININALSVNLNSAIEMVVNRIIGEGYDKYLVEEDDVSQRTGAPYLAEGQMHINLETVSQTKSGTPFLSEPVYSGDTNLYQNNIKVGEEYYPLATNMPLHVDEDTKLFYRYIGSNVWNPIEAKDGMLLSEALKGLASGVYTIREYSKEGVSEFSFYLDKNLPILNVTKDEGLDSESELNLDGEITVLTCKSLVLNELLNEADPFAYVAVYSYPNKALQTVLYKEDVTNYDLSGGNYYLQVGDRSGNVVTYLVLTSTSQMDVTVEENESKTGVIVKVTNRDDSEIYSYEVFLNETLIDSEYSATKFYRGSGVYRIEITDIYGNRETRIISHESPSPEITWYYLNDNDGYSVYDPDKPVRMFLEEDITSPRTTNIYSSTLVRLLFKEDYSSSNIQFEILDIEDGEYTFNPTTGLLSINTLASWRLRVWYENQPENDHIYIFHLDNTPPEIAGTFIGTNFHHYVEYDEQGNVIITSSFDAIDYTKYSAGEAITLDTLHYEKDGTTTITFNDGGIISGSHIVIQVSDPTGIKSFTITRNGQPLTMELNVDNKLLINSYGVYVLTFTDLLGNTSIFTFNNFDGLISGGLVDGEIIEDDVIMYGHDELEVRTLFNGENTILVTDEYHSDTFIFKNDGNSVTFGQYIVREGGTDEEGEPIEGKYSVFVQNPNFELFIDDSLTKLGTWYTALTKKNYAILVMVDENLKVNYKVVCLESAIEVESSFSTGNTHLPSHYIANLSKEEPDITLLTGDEIVVPKEGSEYIYIADDLSIDPNSISSHIKTIEYAYAATPEFGEFITIYENGQFVKEFVGKEDGFYQIVVTNIYNSKKTYTISKIVSFVSAVVIHTLDGSSVTYYKNDGSVIYASASIELKVFSDSVTFIVNNIPTTGYQEGGVITLELTKEGKYSVRVVGDNGIFEDFYFEIGSDESFLYQEDWITGYNEEALLRDQGYTNTLCSINLGKDVVFVDMVVNDELYVLLYDNITDDATGDESFLTNAIGAYGVGKYVVGFRNKYGDLVTKTVYFNNVPSLYLDRITTSNTSVYEQYDLDFAITHDFYSNFVLRFSTQSTTYIFTINGEEYRLDQPKTIEFSNASGIGSFSYEVTYLDEYGNFVKFDAILLRQDLTVDVSSMETVTLNGSLYTRDDICISFGEGLKATVSIDGQTPVDYSSGFMFYGDGEYAFVVRDIAGNRFFYTINHKSMNHYSLTNSLTDENILFGGVVNNANVTFIPTDGSRLKYVFINGELLVDYASNYFTQTGHWELVIEDAIGNQSFEEFYILNNSLSVFNYTAPFEYEVTEVWRVKPDGGRELLNYRGPSITLDENGDYIVVVTSTKNISSFNFSVSIDDTPPTAKLNGVENNGVTAKDVTLSGLRVGDVVKIYKDGELISTITINLSTDSPTINTGGRYRITVTNVQGVTVEYNFVRKQIANVAGSIFVIISAGIVVTGIAFGLIYHTKLKTDD